MSHEQIWQAIKRSPTLLAGLLMGAIATSYIVRFPVLLEVNLAPEERYIKFDSRVAQWCTQETKPKNH